MAQETAQTYDAVLEQIRNGKRNWLVTGVAGFIGSNLLETLLKLDQPVVGLDNFSTGNPGNLQLVREAVGEERWKLFRFIEGDIRSADTCKEACRTIDVVLHQAALGSVPRSVVDPVATTESNVMGFLNMLVAARDADVHRVVYASSSSVYGDDPRLPKVEPQIGRPLSPYALSKQVNELQADVFTRCYGLGAIGLRYFNVFGPRQNPEGAYAAVIAKWIASMLRNETISINGDGETARDFCYVENVVQANLLSAMTEDPAAINQAYNVGFNCQTSLNQLFEILQALISPTNPRIANVWPVYRDFRPGDMRFSRADIGKASRLLGYAPRWSVHAGLEQTVAWYVSRINSHDGHAGGEAASGSGAIPVPWHRDNTQPDFADAEDAE
ncbi:MAG TPA: SDR family oxidoreductase [Rhodocyclaceae bacterium]|nr:SDR family oxidoreductase [Rhodocyclaceae bacterium]